MKPLKTLCIASTAILTLGCAPRHVYVQQPLEQRLYAAKAALTEECRSAIVDSAKITNYLHPRLKACLRRNDKKACGEIKGYAAMMVQTNYFPQKKAIQCANVQNFGGFDAYTISAITDREEEIVDMLEEYQRKYSR